MADTSTSDRAGWRSMLDEVTEAHNGELVTIEVVDPSIGSQHEAERLPFSYLTYDPKDDVVVVAVGFMRQFRTPDQGGGCRPGPPLALLPQ